MGESKITRLKVKLIAKGTAKIEAQVDQDLGEDDPDLMIGKDVLERVLESEDHGNSSST